MNKRLVLETCCEIINVKSFVELQFCLEEVREIERTRLDNSTLVRVFTCYTVHLNKETFGTGLGCSVVTGDS